MGLDRIGWDGMGWDGIGLDGIGLMDWIDGILLSSLRLDELDGIG